VRVRFVTPPKSLQKGGIENAVDGLRAALLDKGVEVIDQPDPSDRVCVHHFHGMWDINHARLARDVRRKGGRYVVSPHGMLEPWAFRLKAWKKRPFFALLGRSMLQQAAAVFVTSVMEATNLRKVVKLPCVEVLPLGCKDPSGPDYENARERLGWRSNDKVLLYLSRIDRKKGLNFLIDALNSLKDESIRLVVVGDGDEGFIEELKCQVEGFGLSDKVEWVGGVWGQSRWDYLQGADLFCLPTHSENFGIAVLEAMLVGTPILTSTATPWSNECGRNGVWICEPNSNAVVNKLPEAIDAIGAWGAVDRISLSNWATTTFGWERLANLYIEAYERACD